MIMNDKSEMAIEEAIIAPWKMPSQYSFLHTRARACVWRAEKCLLV